MRARQPQFSTAASTVGNCYGPPLANFDFRSCRTHVHSTTEFRDPKVQVCNISLLFSTKSSRFSCLRKLNRAVCRMKQLADKRRSDRNFEEGDWVWLKLQPYRQTSLQLRGNQKLSQKYYGPYKVLAKVGKVAYKLQLPSTAKIRNVFHVSQLKSFHGASPITNTLPDWIENADPTLSTEPEVVIDQRNFQDEEATYKQYLVQWKGSPAYEATWVNSADFHRLYPKFKMLTSTQT